MEVLGNTASVRKYYRNHRNDIIEQKRAERKEEGSGADPTQNSGTASADGEMIAFRERGSQQPVNGTWDCMLFKGIKPLVYIKTEKGLEVSVF